MERSRKAIPYLNFGPPRRAPMTQNECYSNIIAPGSTRKGGSFGPCPQFNGSAPTPWRQSSGILSRRRRDWHFADSISPSLLMLLPKVEGGQRNERTLARRLGIFPDDPAAVDMVNVDEAYDADAANVVRRAHSEGKPFFCECAAALACLCRAFHVAEEPRCCRLLRQPPHPRAAIRGVSV